jgi:hypothetical protein
MKDTLRKWYKDGFDQLKVITPTSVWKKVSDRMKSFPAGWYQLNADEVDVKPMPGSWDAISASLQPYNQSKKDARRFIYRGVAAIAIFAIIPFGFNDMSSITADSKIAQRDVVKNGDLQFSAWISSGLKVNSDAINKMNTAFVSSNQDQYNLALRSAIDSNLAVLVISNKMKPTILPVDRTLPLAQKEPVLDRNSADWKVIDQLSLLALLPSVTNVQQGDVSKLTVPEPRLISSKKWGIGPKINFHGTTLLTPQTSLALNSAAKSQNPLGLNVSFGLTGIYEMNQKNTLEVDLMFNDRKSQRIKDYTDGSFVERRTDFLYTTASLSYKRNLLNPKGNAKFPKKLNLTSGVYGSYRMNIAEFLDNKEITYFQEGYRSYDLGVNIGFDYSVRLSSKFQWNTGVKYQIGLVNIFAGIDKVPASFFRSYTQSVGATTSILFRF